ncbi:unnamed protein product, partial [Mesorhabditis spiculigera]
MAAAPAMRDSGSRARSTICEMPSSTRLVLEEISNCVHAHSEDLFGAKATSHKRAFDDHHATLGDAMRHIFISGRDSCALI